MSENESDAKLRELILFIADHSTDDPYFGAVKLNKLLVFADFVAFRRLGHAITGQEYQSLEHGPAPRRLVPVQESMNRDGDLAIRERNVFGNKQHQPTPLRSANLSVFSADEIDLVFSVLQHFRGKTARQVSDESHQFVGWELAKRGDTIPYEASLFDDRELTISEREEGLRLEAMARECLARRVT